MAPPPSPSTPPSPSPPPLHFDSGVLISASALLPELDEEGVAFSLHAVELLVTLALFVGVAIGYCVAQCRARRQAVMLAADKLKDKLGGPPSTKKVEAKQEKRAQRTSLVNGKVDEDDEL